VHRSTENSSDVECRHAEAPVAGERKPRGAVAQPRRLKRVYLMAPARWKSSRLSASTLAMDWSLLPPAPSAWILTPTVAVERSLPIARGSASTVRMALTLARSMPLLVALDYKRLTRVGFAGMARMQQTWSTLHPSFRHTALGAVSFGAMVAAIAVPLGMVVAHPQPEWKQRSAGAFAKMARNGLAAPSSISLAYVAPVLLPPVADFHGVTVTTSASAPTFSSSAATLPSTTPEPAADAFVPDASTMDLMMPIAEPDLDIASHQSLWAQVGKSAGVDPLLLYSIALVESKSLHPGGEVAPTPWLFRVNDHLVTGERHHVQMEMAVASQLNATVQDVGIMQVYYPMHRSAVRDPLSLLDPRTNISVAAKILHDGMHETRDPVLGVGYYHSHTQQLARDYGTAVMTVYQRLKMVYRSGKNAQVMAR
jgi:hypothetical protein